MQKQYICGDFCTKHNDEDVIVTYRVYVAYEGHSATGPTYACGGEPASGPELEIDIVYLRTDDDAKTVIDLTPQLRTSLEEKLNNDDVFVEHVLEEHRQDHPRRRRY